MSLGTCYGVVVSIRSVDLRPIGGQNHMKLKKQLGSSAVAISLNEP